jgi:hypothetical protein
VIQEADAAGLVGLDDARREQQFLGDQLANLLRLRLC